MSKLRGSNVRGSGMGDSCQSGPYSEEFYPTMEENIDKKVHLFFEYGKRLKGQIKAMHEREL